MKKIGILGGTFNPPHIGHLIVANEVKSALGLDEVRLMPTAIPPHKVAQGDATAEERLQMVTLAVSGVVGLTACAYEVERGGVSYTYETMKRLTFAEPETTFHFIIGGDMIDQLPTWYRIEELLKLVQFVGVNRPGNSCETEYPIELVDIPQIDLSSSLIRKRFFEKKTVRFLIPHEVEAYIREVGLYGC